ncbi:MAG: hypothetical protein Q4B96_06670 [Bacillota bacterium]|nr:hypothetical protein [Bacillota bacterium]
MNTLTKAESVALLCAVILCGFAVIFGAGASLGHNAWLAVAAALPAGLLPLALCSTAFTAAGRAAGRIAAALSALLQTLLVGYFCSRILRLWSELSSAGFNDWLYYALMVLLICYGAHLGLRGLARVALPLLALLLAAALADSLLLLGEYDVRRLLPLAAADAPQLWSTAALIAVAIYGLTPQLLLIGRQILVTRRLMFIAIAIGGGYCLWATLRNVLIFGELLRSGGFPVVRALRLIDVGRGLTHLETLPLLFLLAVAMIGASAAVYCSVRQLQSRWQLGHYPALIGVGVFQFAVGLFFIY